MIIVFSKDRAFQLEACLRSLLAQCQDVNEVPIRVLWTVSNSNHRQSYAILCILFAYRPNIEFMEESSFRSDLMVVWGGVVRNSWRGHVVRRAAKLSGSWARKLIQPFMSLLVRPAPVVLYVVDDSIFLRSFCFSECAKRLLAMEDALAFSLRLGRGLTRFYMGDRDQEVPKFTPVEEDSGIYQFRWADADGDFGYPLEISSSLLKSKLILSRLLRKDWRSPNTLEMTLAGMAGRYRKKHPLLLTFQDPRAVSVPLNIVQQDFTDNRHGGQKRYDADSLCGLFLKGIRADLSGLDQIKPASVHAEIDLLPMDKLRTREESG
jgi:hypothetical protein